MIGMPSKGQQEFVNGMQMMCDNVRQLARNMGFIGSNPMVQPQKSQANLKNGFIMPMPGGPTRNGPCVPNELPEALANVLRLCEMVNECIPQNGQQMPVPMEMANGNANAKPGYYTPNQMPFLGSAQQQMLSMRLLSMPMVTPNTPRQVYPLSPPPRYPATTMPPAPVPEPLNQNPAMMPAPVPAAEPAMTPLPVPVPEPIMKPAPIAPMANGPRILMMPAVQQMRRMAVMAQFGQRPTMIPRQVMRFRITPVMLQTRPQMRQAIRNAHAGMTGVQSANARAPQGTPSPDPDAGD